MTVGRLRMAEIYFQTLNKYMEKNSPCVENIGEAHLESLQAVFDLGRGVGGLEAAKIGIINQNILKKMALDLEKRSVIAEKWGDAGKATASTFRSLAQSINDGSYLEKLKEE